MGKNANKGTGGGKIPLAKQGRPSQQGVRNAGQPGSSTAKGKGGKK